MFAAAPVEIRSAVVDLLASRRRERGSRSILEAWITETLEKHPKPRIPDEGLVTRGRHHDLARIAATLLRAELRADFDDSRTVPRLTWGNVGKRRPVRGTDGRWIRHGPELVRRERTYPDLARSLAWERTHIDRLIRSARTGRPMKAPRKTPMQTKDSRVSAALRLIQGLLFD